VHRRQDFAAGGAVKEIEAAQTVKSTGAVPSGIALGRSYEPEVVLDVLDHLALYWSPAAERKAPRTGQVAADRDLRLRRGARRAGSHREVRFDAKKVEKAGSSRTSVPEDSERACRKSRGSG